MIKKLFQNSISNVGILILKLAVAFVLTPCIVHALGNHDYGIYEIVLSVVGYMGMLEIGMQPAVTRFVARYAAADDTHELRRIFSSALVFSLAIGAVVSLALLLWSLLGAPGLVPKGALSARYSVFLVIVACQVLVSFPGNVLTSVHHGHQRYWLTSLLTTVNTIIGTTIIYILLKHGYGLLILTLVNTVGITLKYINFGLLLRFNRFGGYKFSFHDVSMDTMRELMKFGFKSFALGIATRVRNSTDSIVLGSVIGPAVVAYYMIPANLTNQMRNMISALTLGFMPFFSELNALDDPEKIREAFYVSSRYMVGVVVCGFLGIFFVGPAFLDVWMGHEYASKGKWVLFIMAAAGIVQMLNPLHGRVLTGMGKHGQLAKLRMMEAALNLVISIVLAMQIGKEGVALGTLIPAMIFEPIILALVCRQLHGRVLDYFAQVCTPSLIAGVATAGFYYGIISYAAPAGYLGIVALVIASSIIYLLLFSLTIPHKERSRFVNALKMQMSSLQR